MSSSLIWLPPTKYESIKALWQGQYIWSALPVDNTIPLHQTAFLCINENDAKTARSRANTLGSRASTGSIPDVSSANKVLEQAAQDSPCNEDQSHRLSDLETSDDRSRQKIKARPSLGRLRPVLSSSKRLRSFHLPARIRTGPTPVVKTPLVEDAKVDAGPPAAQEIKIGSDDKFQEKTVEPGTSGHELFMKPSMIKTGENAMEQRKVLHGQMQEPFRGQGPRKMQRRRHSRNTNNPEGPKQRRQHQKPMGGPTGENHVDRRPSDRTRKPPQLSLRLDLNLDIEIQLKVTLHGDLTLSLLS